MPRANYRDVGPPAPALHGWAAWLDDRPQLPYLLPFMAFVAFMAPGAFFGHLGGIDWEHVWHVYKPAIYAIESLVAAFFLVLCWHHFTPIRWTHLRLGAIVGLVGTVLWIAVEYASQYVGLHGPPDPSTLYNPDIELHTTAARWTYLCIRVVGPTLVVPFMEELFFRDFLMRALIRGARFQDVPIGTFTWFSFFGTVLLFGLNHGIMWPAGIAYGILMGLLLVRSKSLGACIVAHATTNLTLYLFVIYFGNWQFM